MLYKLRELAHLHVNNHLEMVTSDEEDIFAFTVNPADLVN